MSEEKTSYNSIDHKGLKEKMSQVMLNMIKSKNVSDDADEIFQEVKGGFTEDELAYMAACFIGMEFKRSLENPVFLMLTRLLKQAYELCEEGADTKKQDDLMKQVMQILKN